MGRNGFQGKGKPKMGDRNFGAALIKSHARTMDDSFTNKNRYNNMNSILQSTHLDEFVSASDMADRQHEVYRPKTAAELQVVEATTIASVQKLNTSEFSFQQLKIPRKPAWNRQMSAEEVDRNEKESFLDWRREIANLEETYEHLKVTPFEKNLEVWRQLWRVLERCDIVFQIVDARNPLLYYTEDLIKYASEMTPAKPMFLLVNKADYLTQYQRDLWARELESMGIKFAFYSAITEQKRIDDDATAANAEFYESSGPATGKQMGGTSDADVADVASVLARTKLAQQKKQQQKQRQAKGTVDKLSLMKQALAVDDDDEEEEEEEEEEQKPVAVATSTSTATEVREQHEEESSDDDSESGNESEEESEDEAETNNATEAAASAAAGAGSEDPFCDENAVTQLADDLVFHIKSMVAKEKAKMQELQKKKQAAAAAAALGKKGKKAAAAAAAAAAPSTVFVWGDGSETVANKAGGAATVTTASSGGIGASQGVGQEAAANIVATAATFSSSGVLSTAQYDALIRRRCRVLTREELILLLTMLPKKLDIIPQVRHHNRACVGMVGFPNVGKSSVINTILGVSKSSHGGLRVAVSSTPGKTKHFQTLNINQDMMICDCPGLVFPSFMNSTGEMLCAGVLPINQMRDFVDPANVIASRIPLHLLDAAYGMRIQRKLDIKDNPDRPPTGHEMLEAYCRVKSLVTHGTGNWDEFRACKELLRDFNDGKILFVATPPSLQASCNLSSSSSSGGSATTPAASSASAAAAAAADSTVGSVESAVYTSPVMRRWFQETEAMMSRKERVADRIAVLKLRESEAAAAAAAEEAAGYYDEEGGEDGNDSDAEDVFDKDGNLVKPRREHKRSKRWGKKCRKLRDPTPYSEENGTISYVAYTTNRSKLGGEKDGKLRRNNPNAAYGKEFVNRAMFPHHPSVQKGKQEGAK